MAHTPLLPRVDRSQGSAPSSCNTESPARKAFFVPGQQHYLPSADSCHFLLAKRARSSTVLLSPGRRGSGLAIGLLLRLPWLPDALGPSTPMPGPGERGGGNGTHFPFFSDFKEANRAALGALETTVLSSIFVLALAANACAIALLARRSRGRLRAARCLVLNLFCADLLFISAIPLIVVVRWTESWTLGAAACQLLFYLMSLSGSVTILSLAAVSLERVVSIVRLRPSRAYKGKVVGAFLLGIWVFAALATLPLSLFFEVVPVPRMGREVYICTLIWPSIKGEIAWDVCFATVVFLIPGLVIVISYSKILQIAKASRKRLNASMAYSQNNHIRISHQDFKLLRTLFVLMISFFVMWSPIIITILLILVQKFQPDMNIWPSFFFWIMAFTFSNSVVNPVLYNVVHFKREWRQIFFCCPGLPGKKSTVTETTMRQNNHEHFTLSVISR